MARKPHEPQPWIREAIVQERRRFYESLAYASELYATRHGNPNRASDYREAAEKFATQAADGDIYIAADDLWLALHRVGAADLAAQVNQLGREHARPGRRVWFRIDDNEELHLDLEHLPPIHGPANRQPQRASAR